MILEAGGVKTLKLPARSPILNSHLERWNRSIREECLNDLVFFSEASFQFTIGGYIEPFQQERPHQGLGNEIIKPQFRPSNERGESVEGRQRLGGLLKYYVPRSEKLPINQLIYFRNTTRIVQRDAG